MAFILIAGVVPENAKAASTPVLSMADDKILYLDGSKGVKESDGSTCGISYKKKVPNMIVGYDFDKMSISLKSSDTEIVRISKKEYIVAESVGKATVTVTVYNESKKKIFKKDLLVNVKKNADRVLYEGIKENDVVRVGQTLEIALPTNGKDTDHRELIADKPELVEITPTETENTWSVRFLKPGDVTFTGRAYQSSIYTGTTARTDFKASIRELKLTGAEAIAPNAVKMTFNMNIKRSNYYTEVDYDNSCYYMDNGRKTYFSFSTSQKVSGENMWIYLNDKFTPGKTYYVEFKGSDPIAISIPKEKEEEPEPYVPYTPPAPYPASISITPSQDRLNYDAAADAVTLKIEVRDQYGDYFTVDPDKITWTQDTTSTASFAIDPGLSFAQVNEGKYELTVNRFCIDDMGGTEADITVTAKLTGYPYLTSDTEFKVKKAGGIQNPTDSVRFINDGERILDIAVKPNTYVERASLRLCSYNAEGFYTGDVAFTILTAEPQKTAYVSTQSAIEYALLVKKDGQIINPRQAPCFEVADEGFDDGFANLCNCFKPFDDRPLIQAETGVYTFILYTITPGESSESVGISEQTETVTVVNTQVSPSYVWLTDRTTAEKAAASDFTDCFVFSFAGKTYQSGVSYEVQDNYGFGSSQVKHVTKALVPAEISYSDRYRYALLGSVTITVNIPCTLGNNIFISG